MKKKNNKYIAFILLAAVIFILIMLTVILIINNISNNQLQENENNQNDKTVLNGALCGEECLEYYINIDNDKEYLLNYDNQNMNISVNVFNAEEYENSSLSILVNENQIFKVVDFTTKIKIFKFKDIYVIEYVQSMTQCGNTVDILINKDGKIIEMPALDRDDTFLDENNYEHLPSIMKTEFIEATNSIVVYKETCSMCPNNEYQIGFKYTYSLENGTLKLQNRENIYCYE